MLFPPALNFLSNGLGEYRPKTDAVEYVGAKKLSKPYSNKPDAFEPVDFAPGLKCRHG